MDANTFIESFNEEELIRPRFKETLEPCDIVFLTDTKHEDLGEILDFTDETFEVFFDLVEKVDIKEQVTFRVISALKLFGNFETGDIPTKVLHAHREILYSELSSIKPKLIIPLGNLAMKVVSRKSGLGNKRGAEFYLGDIPIVPTYHPRQVFLEPGKADLFIQDVTNAYDRFMLHRNYFVGSPYVYCDTLDLVEAHINLALKADVVSIDLETTGLDFKKDVITTFGCAYGEKKAFVIPMYHKDTPFSEEDLKVIISLLSALCANENVKVMHNCKFDVKFLRAAGVPVISNVEDTQILHSLIDENKPHRLLDLCKEEFPEELKHF